MTLVSTKKMQCLLWLHETPDILCVRARSRAVIRFMHSKRFNGIDLHLIKYVERDLQRDLFQSLFDSYSFHNPRDSVGNLFLKYNWRRWNKISDFQYVIDVIEVLYN